MTTNELQQPSMVAGKRSYGKCRVNHSQAGSLRHGRHTGNQSVRDRDARRLATCDAIIRDRICAVGGVDGLPRGIGTRPILSCPPVVVHPGRARGVVMVGTLPLTRALFVCVEYQLTDQWNKFYWRRNDLDP